MVQNVSANQRWRTSPITRDRNLTTARSYPSTGPLWITRRSRVTWRPVKLPMRAANSSLRRMSANTTIAATSAPSPINADTMRPPPAPPSSASSDTAKMGIASFSEVVPDARDEDGHGDPRLREPPGAEHPVGEADRDRAARGHRVGDCRGGLVDDHRLRERETRRADHGDDPVRDEVPDRRDDEAADLERRHVLDLLPDLGEVRDLRQDEHEHRDAEPDGERPLDDALAQAGARGVAAPMPASGSLASTLTSSSTIGSHAPS